MNELRRAIEAFAALHPAVKILDAAHADEARRAVAKSFGLADRGHWWWQQVKGARSISYESRGLEQLASTLPDSTSPMTLFVTDDDPPPWMCIRSTKHHLLALLAELHFFEYFITDEELTWLVFDTHHNTLVSLGLP